MMLELLSEKVCFHSYVRTLGIANSLVFHDCGTWSTDQGNTGGCDGSLILAQEYNRAENNGLQDISAKLQALAQKYKVGVADTIVMASSVAVLTCPKGPTVRFYITLKTSTLTGRSDQDLCGQKRLVCPISRR